MNEQREDLTGAKSSRHAMRAAPARYRTCQAAVGHAYAIGGCQMSFQLTNASQ